MPLSLIFPPAASDQPGRSCGHITLSYALIAERPCRQEESQ